MWHLLYILYSWVTYPIRIREQREKRAEARKGRCQRCGYLLHGLAEDRCPECGLTSPSLPPKESNYSRNLIVCSLLVFGLPTLLVFLCTLLWSFLTWEDPGPVLKKILVIGLVLTVGTFILGITLGAIIDEVREASSLDGRRKETRR